MKQASTRGMPSPSTPGMKSMRGPITLNGRTMVKGSPRVLAVRPDHPLEQLLGGRVGPALALHRPEEERGLVLDHRARRAAARVERRPAVHLAGREVHEPAAARRAQLHERQQIGEAGVDHVERPGVVEGRVAERGQRHHHFGARGSARPAARARRCPPRSAARAGRPRSSLSSVRSTATISAPGRRASRGTRCEPTKPPAPSTAMRRGTLRREARGRRDGAEAWHGPGACVRGTYGARPG